MSAGESFWRDRSFSIDPSILLTHQNETPNLHGGPRRSVPGYRSAVPGAMLAPAPSSVVACLFQVMIRRNLNPQNRSKDRCFGANWKREPVETLMSSDSVSSCGRNYEQKTLRERKAITTAEPVESVHLGADLVVKVLVRGMVSIPVECNASATWRGSCPAHARNI